MTVNSIYVPVSIDAACFRRFSYFETMHRQKRWRSPLLFALILTACAIICLIFQSRSEGSVLLGVVLLTLGSGLPIAYFSNFACSVRNQIKRMGIKKKARNAYNIMLDDKGISITAQNEIMSYAWDQIAAAYRTSSDIYLYITLQRAYLLPNGQATKGDDALWEMISHHLPAAQVFDLRH